MRTAKESGLLIADKLQPHLRDLQRPEEVHFDPISLAVVVSFCCVTLTTESGRPRRAHPVT